MEVKSVTQSTSEYVETNEPDWPTYRRYTDGTWERLVGEAWEPVWKTIKLEAAYQEFINAGVQGERKNDEL